MQEVLLCIIGDQSARVFTMLVVAGLNQLVLRHVLHLQLVDDFLGPSHAVFVSLRRRVVLYLLDVDVFALNLLNALALMRLVFPVLVELRETRSDVVNKQLRKFRIGLNHEAEELTVVVVNDLAQFLFERERLELFPCQVLGLKHKYAVLQFKRLFRLGWHELFGFL